MADVDGIHVETGKSPIPYISLFSGAGGFDLGLEAVGFEARACVDIDYHSSRTLAFNRSLGRRTGLHTFLNNAVVLNQGLAEISPSRLLRASRLAPGEVPLVVGGPPCQSFSVFGGRKGMDDPRGLLWREFARIVRTLRPRAFLFENVAGLLTVDGGKPYSQIFDGLSNKGGDPEYRVSAHLIDAAHFGVPQFRTRLFIFGSRDGVTVPKPQSTHVVDWPRTSLVTDQSPNNETLLKCPTVKDFLHGLPAISPDLWMPNHVGRRHSTAIIDRYQTLTYGQRDPKTRVNKLHPDRPSYTIIVGSDKGGGKGHVHPYEPREVTPRESARAQTFPDTWWLSGTSRHPIRQVGNAIPPILGAAVGLHARQHMFGIDEAVSYTDILGRLGVDYLLDEPISFPEWLKDVFRHLSREQEAKSISGLWRTIERYIPHQPEGIDIPVLQEVAD